MRVCIIGYGNMGKRHERVLESMGHEVMTVDTDPGAGAEIGLSGDRAHSVYPLADAYCVATPIPLLGDVAIACADAGPVLVEKPGGQHLWQARQLHLYGKHPVIVGYTECFNPAVNALRDNLDAIGTVRHVSARRLGYASENAPDPALDLATHDLEVLHYLGFEPELIHAAASPRHVSALLRDGETTFSIEASHLHRRKIRDLELTGDHGTLRVDYQAKRLFIENIEITIPDRDEEPLRREWEAFFRGEGRDGIATLKLAEQMMLVARQPTLRAVA